MQSWMQQKGKRGYTLLHSLAEAQNWRCAYCHVVMTQDETPSGWSRDHFLARYCGGDSSWGNLFASCRTCNSARQHFDALVFYELVQQRGCEGARGIVKRWQSNVAKGRPVPGSVRRAIWLSQRWAPVKAAIMAERARATAAPPPRAAWREEANITLADVWPEEPAAVEG